MHSDQALLEEIQKKREKMIHLAQKTGFTSEETIRCSHELDQLIYEYQISSTAAYKQLQNYAIRLWTLLAIVA
ncbi:aspartyl-phosphate phosphatase Spo0E family protein [Bacillus sp. T33-2]|uniref:aspartyl-phosphate phosphatase Spo0E family protein n=1 Tax=Bacillus sp. T33-2 TaxID=2054168 RepID=UPI00267DCD5B